MIEDRFSSKRESKAADRTTFRSGGVTIGRDQILARYWELAQLDATQTKDNIAGQLKALDSLCEELRPVEGNSTKPLLAPSFYRAAWMPDDQPEN